MRPAWRPILGMVGCILAVVAPKLASDAGSPAPGNASRIIDGKQFLRDGRIGPDQLQALRNEARFMFSHGFDNYMQKAFPKDDLRPISCRGTNSQGGIALSLVDALDTLILLGEQHEVRRAVHWLRDNLSFDVDERVHVFELTIRALGGLLSAHVLLLRDPNLVPDYDGSLLRLAQDLGDRLLPAFDTPSGIPLSWVNLAKGVLRGEIRATCTACAGTLLLEFGLLSQLTGDPKYERHAHHAAVQLFHMRSKRTGLLGNTLNVDSATWVRKDSGIGAGIDSFYEYLLKAWLVFGNKVYLDMFAKVYSSAMLNLRAPNSHHSGWLVDVHMETGRLTRPWVSSLGAFWPGMQVLVGQIEDAEVLHGNLTAAWKAFNWLPELFDFGLTKRHPVEKGYPLRPELIESTYLLHIETGDPHYLEVARDLQATLMERNKQRCGFASVRDVSTGELEDSMESFFLSETSKYLYLIHSNAPDLLDHFVFSTEGHLIPPLPSRDGRGPSLPAQADIPASCHSVCSARKHRPGQQPLHEAFTLLHVDEGLDIIRPRRCMACVEVVKALAELKGGTVNRVGHSAGMCPAAGEGDADGNCPVDLEGVYNGHNLGVQEWLAGAAAGSQYQRAEVLHQVTCSLSWGAGGQLSCSRIESLEVEEGQTVDQLPQNVVVLQMTAVHVDANSIRVRYTMPGQEDPVDLSGLGASFGPQLEITDEYEDDEDAIPGDEAGGAVISGVAGDLAAIYPTHACEPLGSTGLEGRVAIVDRGRCSFLQKVQIAQNAGAVAVLVVNTLEDGQLVTMGDDGTGAQPDIVAVSLKRSSGEQLRAVLERAEAEGLDVHVDLRVVEQAEKVYLTGSTQINMLIPPYTQTWLFAQTAATGTDLSQALHSVLNNAQDLANVITNHMNARNACDAKSKAPDISCSTVESPPAESPLQEKDEL